MPQQSMPRPAPDPRRAPEQPLASVERPAPHETSTATEVLLRENPRPLLLAMLLPAVVMAIGLGLGGFMRPAESGTLGALGWGVRGLGWALAALGLLAALSLALELLRPRLAIRGEHLLVYGGFGRPIKTPLSIVECFLLGQGPAMLPGKRNENREALTLVVKLADSAADWANRPLRPMIGYWCGGYITLRGAWCERLDVPLVNRLNARLAEAQKSAAIHP